MSVCASLIVFQGWFLEIAPVRFEPFVCVAKLSSEKITPMSSSSLLRILSSLARAVLICISLITIEIESLS